MSTIITELETLLAEATEELQKIDTMNALAWELRDRDPLRGLTLSQIAYDLACSGIYTHKPYYTGMVAGLLNSAVMNVQLSKYDIALTKGFEVLLLVEAQSDSQPLIITLYTIGSAYTYLARYAEALDYYLKALKIARDSADIDNEAHILTHLGLIYHQLEDYQQELAIYNVALQLYRQINNVRGEAWVLNQMAMVYASLSDFPAALTASEQSFMLAKKEELTLLEIHIGYTRGEVFLQSGDYPQALIFLRQSVEVAHTMNYHFIEMSALLTIGKIHQRQNQPNMAVPILRQALLMAQHIATHAAEAQCHYILSLAYTQLNHCAQALEHYAQFHQIDKELIYECANRHVKDVQILHGTDIFQQTGSFSQPNSTILDPEIDKYAEISETTSSIENNLKASQANLVALVNSTNDLILSVDRSYTIITANIALKRFYQTVLGVTSALEPGVNILDVSPPVIAQALRLYCDRVFQYDRFTVELSFYSFIFECTFTPISTEPNHITGGAIFAHDITDRKKREGYLHQLYLEHTALLEDAQKERELAEASNKAKTRFLATMNHELRTPLTSVLGYVQILQRDPSLTQSQREALTIIEQSGDHLLMLINDVLDIAKIEAGKLEIQENDFDLITFIEGINRIIRIWAQRKNIHFYCDIFPTLDASDLQIAVYADERRLRQILINLLGNAIKFTDEGSVTLRVDYAPIDAQSVKPLQANQHLFRFQIEDTGIGISPEDLEAIFKPFQQANTPKTPIQGTGLGLTISANLLQLMGGVLQVSSTPQQGSRFWFDIALTEVVQDTEQSHLVKYRGIGANTTIDHEKGFVPPPADELTLLLNLAMEGDIQSIRQRSEIIQHMGEQFIPFFQHLSTLAKHFQIDTIRTLLRSYQYDYLKTIQKEDTNGI